MKLIGISGKKRSGKDQFVNTFLKYHADNKLEKFIHKKFAGKLKQICALITGKLINDFSDPQQYDMMLDGWNMTVRELQQKVGTEAFRNNVSNDTWVNALFCDWLNNDRSQKGWIISDVRFPNEVKAIKDRGGIVIRINRTGLPNTDMHDSEIALDDYTEWDYIINNDGSLEEYITKVIDVIKKIK